MSRYEVKVLIAVLLIHTGLLAWSAVRHSPTIDEVGHFSAGLSHWRLSRFDLYNVNPPLIRAVATAPLHLNGTSIEFNGYEVLPRHRTEFGIGARFISTHPDSFLSDFAIARWACIPLSFLGAVTCFLWARELYGLRAGWMALCLWCFCPNVLAYGSLITPDAGATAVGLTACYVFRKWLIHRTMGWAVGAGLMLGLTLLTKFTWLFLLGLWPACWLMLRASSRHSPIDAMRLAADASDQESQFVTRRVTGTFKHRWRDDIGHLLLINMLAFWVLNNGCLFEDSFQPLGRFQFFSQSLSGGEPAVAAQEGGNRFRGTLLEHLPVPVPRNFVQGIDHIKFEYEMGYSSYLRGVKRQGGWWYYYLYAMLVKLPVGTLVLIAVAAGQGVFYHRCHGEPEQQTRRADAQPLAGGDWFETLYLLVPAVCTLWLVSSQTGFNHHLRYVLPAFPFLFIFASRTALLLDSRYRVAKAVPIVCMAWMIISSLSVDPQNPYHSLLQREPDDLVGYSMRVYHIKPVQENAAIATDLNDINQE